MAKAVTTTKILRVGASSVTQLSARHSGVGVGEAIITDSPPCTCVANFETAAATTTVGDARVVAHAADSRATAHGVRAAHPNVFVVMAVVPPPSQVAARPDVAFPAVAAHVVEPDAGGVRAEAVATAKILDLVSPTVTQLAARHSCVTVVEVIVTDSAPMACVADFETTAVTTHVGQTEAVSGAMAVEDTTNTPPARATAAHTDVFGVSTVVATPSSMAAGTDGGFVAPAPDVVQPNLPRDTATNVPPVASAEILHLGSRSVTHLTACHTRGIVVEVVITNCTPVATVPHFQATTRSATLCQPH